MFLNHRRPMTGYEHIFIIVCNKPVIYNKNIPSMCTPKYPILFKCLCLLILNTYLQADKSVLPVSIHKLPAAPQTFLLTFRKGQQEK